MERTKRISTQTLAIAILTMLLVASLVMSMTGAWFTSTDGDSDTGLSFGTVTLADIDAGFTFNVGEESIDVLMPGDTIDVDFTLENAGTADMWVRFKLEANGDGAAAFTTGVKDQTVTGYTFKIEDGYFYKIAPALGGATDTNYTQEIDIQFVIATTIADAYEGKAISFNLVVEAIQAANNGTSWDETREAYTHNYETVTWPASGYEANA